MEPPLPLPPPPSPHTAVRMDSAQTPTSKLRLMVSYGGHILPRPHDKTLFYAGGDTRIISISRKPSSLSFSSLFSHLSKSLLNGSHNFSLKYQLPNHDLDSLISISSDEDLFNMIDEYDRLSNSRIRFFLFKTNDDVIAVNNNNSSSGDNNVNKRGVVVDCGGVEEDLVVDKTKVAGSNAGGGDNYKRNSNNSNSNSNDDSPETIVLGDSSSNSPANIKGEGSADDFKVVLPSLDSLGSDCSIPSPNFSQQAIVYQDASGFIDSKPVSASLIDTESVTSDHSLRSDVISSIQVSGYMVSKPMDQPQQLSPPPPPPPPTPTPAPHYIHHPAPPNYVTQYYPGSIPVASYAPMYQTYVPPQQPLQYHHHLQKPYPYYMMPIGRSQNLYDASMPRNLTSAPTVATSQPQVPPSPVMIASPMIYEGYKPASPAPEYAAKVCRPTSVACLPMALPSVNQPAQPVTIPPVDKTSYINEFEDPMHAQIYKTQPSDATLPSQLQMATSAATVMLTEGFNQLKMENAKH
ncbi:hypothetical protein RDABS01_038056 [Bienertia sinuspersici]